VVANVPAACPGCTKLQHSGELARAQAGQQDHLPAREFEGVVVLISMIQVNLPEPSNVLV
jgi:hypothetical protein